MKEQIDLLVKLAEEYTEYIKEIESNDAEIKNGWRHLRGTFISDDNIRVYRSAEIEGTFRESWTVVFLRIEISFYSKDIRFPYNYDSAKFKEIYNDAKEFLDNLKKEIYLLKKKVDEK